MNVPDIPAARIINEESFYPFDADYIAEVLTGSRNFTFHREGEGLG